jgi:hypothetical protein
VVSGSVTPPKIRKAAIAACTSRSASTTPTARFVQTSGGRFSAVVTTPYTASAASATRTTISSAPITLGRYPSGHVQPARHGPATG